MIEESSLRELWDFLVVEDKPQPADAIFLIGGIGERRPLQAAKLYHGGYAHKILITGGVGVHQEHSGETEASFYRKVLLREGVPSEAIVLEEKALNTGENITFGMERIQEVAGRQNKLILVARSFLTLRAVATFRKHYPDIQVLSCSDPETLDQYIKAVPGEEERRIELLRNELRKIIEYPDLGFMDYTEVPELLKKLIN